MPRLRTTLGALALTAALSWAQGPITCPPATVTSTLTGLPYTDDQTYPLVSAGTALVNAQPPNDPQFPVAGQCGTVSALTEALGGMESGGILYVSGLSPATTAYGVMFPQLSTFTSPYDGTYTCTQGTLAYCEYCQFDLAIPFSSLSIQTLAQYGTVTLLQSGSAQPYTITADYISAGSMSLTNAAQLHLRTVIDLGSTTMSIGAGSDAPMSLTVDYMSSAILTVVNAATADIGTISLAGIIYYSCATGSCPITVSNAMGAGLDYNDVAAVEVTGSGASLGISGSNYAVIALSGATATLTGSSGVVEVIGGVASVGGAGGLGLLSAGSLTLGSGASLSFVVDGFVQFSPGATGGVMTQGTAALVDGITVTVSQTSPSATLLVSQGTTITSLSSTVLSDGGTYNVFAAMATHSGGQRRRARLPQQTAGLCGAGMTYCPAVGIQGYACVDTTSDIFNCGGCFQTGGGVDCTARTDQNVRCIAGKCVIET